MKRRADGVCYEEEQGNRFSLAEFILRLSTAKKTILADDHFWSQFALPDCECDTVMTLAVWVSASCRAARFMCLPESKMI